MRRRRKARSNPPPLAATDQQMAQARDQVERLIRLVREGRALGLNEAEMFGEMVCATNDACNFASRERAQAYLAELVSEAVMRLAAK